jgi:hypothetical protein
MASSARSIQWQMLTYGAIGLAEWIVLVAIPARGNPNYSGALFFLAALASALVLGAADSKSPHIRAGLFMAIPCLLLAGWTAPRGDNDGLWILWFPFIVISALLLAGCHRVGSAVRRSFA